MKVGDTALVPVCGDVISMTLTHDLGNGRLFYEGHVLGRKLATIVPTELNDDEAIKRMTADIETLLAKGGGSQLCGNA